MSVDPRIRLLVSRKSRPPSKVDIFRIESTRKPRLRHKRRSDVAGTQKLARRPELTPALAAQFVQMLHAGIPADKALVYFSVEHYEACDERERAAWLSRWSNDPLVARATVAYMKGEWHTLEPDTRLQLALDKHLAELAYLLYSNNYNAPDAPTGKMNVARESLMAYLTEQSSGEETPWMRAVRELVEGKLSDATIGMPVMAVPADTKKQKGN